MINIGKYIRENREAKNWRQIDLANKANLTVDYIGKIERGERVPQLSVFVTLLNLLNASADDVLDDFLEHGFGERLRRCARKIKKLPIKEREMIYAVVDALQTNEHKN